MSSVIDKDDKIWNIFLGYCRLLDAESTNASLDIYGTEQKSNMALGFTQAHMTDHVVCKLKDIEKQNADHNKLNRFNQETGNA